MIQTKQSELKKSPAPLKKLKESERSLIRQMTPTELIAYIVKNAAQPYCYAYIQVSSRLATELLKLNVDKDDKKIGRERKLSSSRSKVYADYMETNRWKEIGNVVKISTTGTLLDGQHILDAIVKTGKPQRLDIRTGIDETLFSYMDITPRRSATDIMYIHEYKYPSVLASALKLLENYHRFAKMVAKGRKGEKREFINYTYQNYDIDKLVKHYNCKSLENMAPACIEYARISKNIIPAPAYLFLSYIFSSHNKKLVEPFFKVLIGNTESPSEKYITYLHDLFQKDRVEYVNPLSTITKFALIIKAWLIYSGINDAPDSGILRFESQTESFPALPIK